VPFGGTLDADNRWVIFSSLMPWKELEETYAPQFSLTTGDLAKLIRLAFGALFINQRLGLTDEETVEQIRESAYIQFFLGFAGYSSKAPFDPSMNLLSNGVRPWCSRLWRHSRTTTVMIQMLVQANKFHLTTS
jgi:hypothetical protein